MITGEPAFKWSAREVARTLYYQAFSQKHLIVVPNCTFPGSECDLLVVRNDLRLMEVEIKISRSDLKADKSKNKWFDHPQRWKYGEERPVPVPRTHPLKIWKHYYALPDKIWMESLIEFIQPTSGIILLRDSGERPMARMHRQAKPSKVAERIPAEDLQHIARLCTVRMWDSYSEVDKHRHRSNNSVGHA